MWHIELLGHLAQKICKTNPDEAALFIKNLFLSVSNSIYPNEPFEALMLMGMVQDVFAFAKKSEGKNISLSRFSQFCLGLIILHVKATDEFRIENKNFLDVITNEEILDVLQINNKLNQLNKRHWHPKRFKHLGIPDSIYIKMLCRIEREVFAALEHKISVDITSVFNALYSLLLEMDNRLEVMTDLLLFIKPYCGLSDRFDGLIALLEDLKDVETQSQINGICVQLESYVGNGKKSYAFWHPLSSSKFKYAKEVNAIVGEIRDGTIQDIGSILEQLYQIKITHSKDKLVGLIGSFEEEYYVIIGDNSKNENEDNFQKEREFEFSVQ